MKYYSTQRPITIGSYPNPPFNKVLEIVNFDERQHVEELGRFAWGYIVYAEPLCSEILIDYELIPVPGKIKPVKLVGVDSFRREVYTDKDGKLWKYTEPGEMPKERHDRLNFSTGNDLDGEPGWPMASDFDYEIVEDF